MTRINDGPDDPPRAAEWLLEVFLRDRVACDGLAGDLRERFAQRRLTSPRWKCAVWYWRQALSASMRYALERFLAPRRVRRRAQRSHLATTRKETSLMAHFLQDLRYAVRMLRKAPGMAAISILALTLGTGMPTIMFTIVNGVLRDLPVDQPDRIFQLFRTNEARGGGRLQVSHHDFADWRTQQTSFEGMAGFTSEDVTLSGGDVRPIRRNAAFVSANTFDVLRVQPILGRSFHPDDESPASNLVVIVSYAVWQSRFAGDPDILGQILAVDGELRTVIGVMPEKFGFPRSEDLWFPLPLALDGLRANSPTVRVFGRLANGVSVEQARAELSTIAARLADAYPEVNGGLGADLTSYSASQIGAELARGLYTMLGAVSFVLLIACANVANLLLARAVNRTQEIAVRTALGARRSRIISQFMIEAFVITVAGGVLGTMLAWTGVRVFNRALTSFIGIPWIDIRIDGAVLLFVVGAVLVGSIFAGILPAVQASGTRVNDALKDDSRGVSSLRIGRFSKGLIIGEIALSCALLVVSGLMIKGVLKLKGVDLGMPVEEIVTGEVEIPRQVYATVESRVRFFEELETSIAAIPGVTAVSMMSDIPATVGFSLPVTVAGQVSDGNPAPAPRVAGLTVTPSFLEVLDASVLTGRGFTAQDRAGSEPVMLVNQRFAAQFFPDRSPVGRTVQWGRGQPRTVVGVVPDLFMGSLDRPNANGPGVYLPLAQAGNVSMQVMVRTAQDPLALTSQIRDALESSDPALALMRVDRVDRFIARGTVIFEIFGQLFLFFGLTALFLASIGLYGVMSFTVSQRTREWGVRLALGAKSSDVIRLVMKQSVIQLVIGLSAGLVIAGALSVPLSNFFYQVEPWDRTIFAIIALILSATGVIATLIPARRATRVDPLESLRYQ